MERKILHISSLSESVTEELSSVIRNLGRRYQRALWGKRFSPDEEASSLLCLDSGGRGSLEMMIRGMDADTVEFLFLSEETGKACLLLSELMIPAYLNEEYFYKSREKASKTLAERIGILDAAADRASFMAINETPFERSRVYSSRISEVKGNVKNGYFHEGDINELFEEIPDVIICDAFTKNGAMAILENRMGKPRVVHIMNGKNSIYVPYSAIGREMFIETEYLMKEALLAICLWLYDVGEAKSGEILYSSFRPLKLAEELILRTEQRFMKIKTRKRRQENEH